MISRPICAPIFASWICFLENHRTKLEALLLETIASDPALANAQGRLTSIDGIGAKSAAVILVEIPEIDSLQDARQLAAFAGVTPAHQPSGTSGRSRSPQVQTRLPPSAQSPLLPRHESHA